MNEKRVKSFLRRGFISAKNRKITCSIKHNLFRTVRYDYSEVFWLELKCELKWLMEEIKELAHQVQVKENSFSHPELLGAKAGYPIGHIRQSVMIDRFVRGDNKNARGNKLKRYRLGQKFTFDIDSRLRNGYIPIMN